MGLNFLNDWAKNGAEARQVNGGATPPHRPVGKMQDKENTTFLALLRLSIAQGKTQKNDLKHILKRLVRGGGGRAG